MLFILFFFDVMVWVILVNILVWLGVLRLIVKLNEGFGVSFIMLNLVLGFKF